MSGLITVHIGHHVFFLQDQSAQLPRRVRTNISKSNCEEIKNLLIIKFSAAVGQATSPSARSDLAVLPPQAAVGPPERGLTVAERACSCEAVSRSLWCRCCCYSGLLSLGASIWATGPDMNQKKKKK